MKISYIDIHSFDSISLGYNFQYDCEDIYLTVKELAKAVPIFSDSKEVHIYLGNTCIGIIWPTLKKHSLMSFHRHELCKKENLKRLLEKL